MIPSMTHICAPCCFGLYCKWNLLTNMSSLLNFCCTCAIHDTCAGMFLPYLWLNGGLFCDTSTILCSASWTFSLPFLQLDFPWHLLKMYLNSVFWHTLPYRLNRPPDYTVMVSSYSPLLIYYLSHTPFTLCQ